MNVIVKSIFVKLMKIKADKNKKIHNQKMYFPLPGIPQAPPARESDRLTAGLHLSSPPRPISSLTPRSAADHL